MPPSFAPDFSAWAISNNPSDMPTEGVVHFALSPEGRSIPAAPLFRDSVKENHSRNTCIPTIASPSPTPPPPLPPDSGAVRFVYAAGGGTDQVFAYWAHIDGTLVPVRGSPFKSPHAPIGVTVDPIGRFLFVAGWSDTISVYSIDGKTGGLTTVPGSPFAAGKTPASVAVDPAGKFAYANNINTKNVSVYSIAAIGRLSAVSGSPFSVERYPMRLVLNPSHNVVYVVIDRAIEVFSTARGGFEKVGEAPIPDGSGGNIVLAVGPRGGYAYATKYWKNTIATYSIARTGMLQLLPGPEMKVGIKPEDIQIDPRDRFAYVVSVDENSVSGFRVNDNAGTLTPVSGSPFRVNGPKAMTITPDGRFLYITVFAGSIAGFAIDQKSGELTPVPDSPLGAASYPQGIASCRRVGNVCKPS